MKSNLKINTPGRSINSPKPVSAPAVTAIAIGKKLLEIKRISGTGDMPELNMALWRHLK